MQRCGCDECGHSNLNVCVCLTGKRIPVADAAGATSGKGFKLGRQASVSRRTCCWWYWWLSPHDPWPDLLLSLSISPACFSTYGSTHPTSNAPLPSPTPGHHSDDSSKYIFTAHSQQILTENCWQEKSLLFRVLTKCSPHLSIEGVSLASLMDTSLCLVYCSTSLIKGTSQIDLLQEAICSCKCVQIYLPKVDWKWLNLTKLLVTASCLVGRPLPKYFELCEGCSFTVRVYNHSFIIQFWWKLLSVFASISHLNGPWRINPWRMAHTHFSVWYFHQGQITNGSSDVNHSHTVKYAELKGVCGCLLPLYRIGIVSHFEEIQLSKFLPWVKRVECYI